MVGMGPRTAWFDRLRCNCVGREKCVVVRNSNKHAGKRTPFTVWPWVTYPDQCLYACPHRNQTWFEEPRRRRSTAWDRPMKPGRFEGDSLIGGKPLKRPEAFYRLLDVAMDYPDPTVMDLPSRSRPAPWGNS